MPYRDPEQQRAYQRDYKRLRRTGDPSTPRVASVPLPFRLTTASHVLELLEEQIAAVRSDEEAGTLERARCIGYLLTVALKAIEAGDLAVQVAEIREVLKMRKAG